MQIIECGAVCKNLFIFILGENLGLSKRQDFGLCIKRSHSVKWGVFVANGRQMRKGGRGWWNGLQFGYVVQKGLLLTLQKELSRYNSN